MAEASGGDGGLAEPGRLALSVHRATASVPAIKEALGSQPPFTRRSEFHSVLGLDAAYRPYHIRALGVHCLGVPLPTTAARLSVSQGGLVHGCRCHCE